MSSMANTTRSYIVTTSDGQQYRRNRCDLLKTGEPAPTTTEPTQDETEGGLAKTYDKPPDNTDNLPSPTITGQPPWNKTD